MEGAVSGVVVPSGTILEVETWVKFSKIPVEFMTAAALSRMAATIGSPVQMDEATFEKLEDAKWPPPLRRNKSKKTSANLLIKIRVTAPLPPGVVVICPKGRRYTIQIVSEPNPKICLNCFCDGHFDFECCGAKVVTVESLDVGAVAVEDFVGGDLLLDECFDSMSDEVNGEQGAVITAGAEIFEDSTVVDATISPAATCDVGDAIVGELEAVHSCVAGFFEQPLEERTAAGLKVQPLLPAPIAADRSEGTFISDGFVCREDPPAACEFGAAKMGDLEAVLTFSDSFDDDPLVGKEIAADPLATVGESIATDLQAMILADPCIVVEQLSGEFHNWRDFTDDQGLLEAVSGAAVGILGVEIRDVGSLRGIGAVCDGVHGAVIFDRAECHDLSPVVEAELAEDLHHFEQVVSVVNCPKKHQKWRDKSDVQGLFSSQLQGMADPYMIDVQASPGVNRAKKHHLWCDLFDEQGLFSVEQLLSVANCLSKHHKWRDKSVVLGLWCDNLDEQGMFSFEKLDVLQMLPSLVWILAATYHDQFKIHHKWRDKGC